MATIFLIGTSHRFQVANSAIVAAHTEAFRVLVRGCAISESVSGIGEEISLAEVQNRDATESVCEEVANALSITHCYCDPNEDERSALGIEQENAILARALISRPRGTTQEEARKHAAPLIAASHAKREAEWLRRLKAVGLERVLFVCGANHVDSFRYLLERNGYVACVLEHDWEPT